MQANVRNFLRVVKMQPAKARVSNSRQKSLHGTLANAKMNELCEKNVRLTAMRIDGKTVMRVCERKSMGKQSMRYLEIRHRGSKVAYTNVKN